MRNPIIYTTPAVGYELNPARGFFSIVEAQEAENLVFNPSVELNLDGYLALGIGTMERSEEEQVFGAFSLKYTPSSNPTDGVYYPISLLPETIYTGSIHFKGVNSAPYRFYLYDNDLSFVMSEYQFYGKGRWERLMVTGTTGTGLSDVSAAWIVIRKNNDDDETPFYLDGVQLEQRGYATTYLDGDMVGLIPGQKAFYWTGTRHASTSVRIAETNAGGRVKRLDEAGLKVIGMPGTGMPPITNIASPLALTGGDAYQRSIPNQRPFTIIGDITASSLLSLQRKRLNLVNLLKPTTLIPQPILLRYQLFSCHDPLGEELEIPCVYAGGLEGNTDNAHHERVSIQFLAYTPFWRKVVEKAQVSLDAVINNPSCDYIAQRKFDLEGALRTAWQRVAQGTNGVIRVAVWGPDGRLYIGGDFTEVNQNPPGGSQVVNHLAVYNPLLDEWDDLNSGANDDVRAIVFDSTGRMYVGGDFTEIGAPPVVVNNVAYWEGGTWNAMDDGVGGGNVYALAVDAYNGVYVAGDITSVDGLAIAVERIGRWFNDEWSAIITDGANDTILTLSIDLESDDVYIGGEFTTFDTKTVNRIVKYIPDSEIGVPLGSGVDATVYCSLFANGKLYIGGEFVEANGNDVGAISTGGKAAVWDGAIWSAMGGGLSGGLVRQIAFDPKYGEYYLTGTFTHFYQSTTRANSQGYPLLDGFVGWNGAAWFYPDVDLPGSPASVDAIATRQDGRMVVAFGHIGNAVTTNLFLIQNNGTADAYPRIFMYGEGQVYQIVNYTTGEGIYLNNVIVLPGEVIILDLTPGQKTMISNIRGNLLSRIAAGSDLATWRLKPGQNVVSIHLPNALAEVTITWKETFWSLDGTS